MLKNTVIDRHKTASQTAVVSKDTEKLEDVAYVVSVVIFYTTTLWLCILLSVCLKCQS